MAEITYSRDTFSAYIFTIWRKKYLILGIAALLAMITAGVFSIRGLFSEQYEVHAALFVVAPPSIAGIDYALQRTPVISFESLLLSDDLINEILKKTAEKFNRKLKLESFKNRFKVRTEIVEDTSMRRSYSPVIELTAYGNTPLEAEFIMRQWIDLSIKRYGDLAAQSVKFFLDYYWTNLQETQNRLKEKEAEYVKVKWELHSKMKELIDKENLIAPAEIPLDLRRRMEEMGLARTAQNVDVIIQQREGPPPQGLMAKLANLEIEIARLEKVEKVIAETQKNPQKIILEDEMLNKTRDELIAAREQHAALKGQIDQINGEISSLQKIVSDLELRHEQLGREVQDLRDKFELFSRLKNQIESYAGIINYQGDYPPEHRSELRLVASAITPEIRIFPKRALFSLIAAIVGLLLATIFVVLNKYLTEIALIEREKAVAKRESSRV